MPRRPPSPLGLALCPWALPLPLLVVVVACSGQDSEGQTGPDAGDPGGAVAELEPLGAGHQRGRLKEVGAARGLGAVDLARAEPGRWFMPDSMAGGCALFDADGDGDLDVFLCHGLWRAEGGGPVEGGLGRLLLQGGDGTFTDVSDGAGVVGAHFAMGVAVGDYDQDGDRDLYVTCLGPDRLLRNDGEGRFEDVSEASGVAAATAGWGASCAFCDLDGDGRLDVVAARYLELDVSIDAADARGVPEFPSPVNFPGASDVVLLGRADGTFEDASERLGSAAQAGHGLGVAPGDWNDDGRLDVFVANDGNANHCWIQQEDGTFEEQALKLGLALSGEGRPEAGMGVARGDLDGDGRDELVLTHLATETHTLYQARRDGSYRDRSLASGLARPSLDLTGFGDALVDLDLDGWLDLVAVHGRVLRGPARKAADHEPERWRPYAEPDWVLMGGADGRFEAADWGDFSRRVETSRGLACGDIDRDGDVDLLVTTAAGEVRLFENEGAPQNALTVRALDPTRGGLEVHDARVTLTTPAGTRSAWIQPCHGYLSSSEPVARFAIREADRAGAMELSVRWPDGSTDVYPVPTPSGVVELHKGAGR